MKYLHGACFSVISAVSHPLLEERQCLRNTVWKKKFGMCVKETSLSGCEIFLCSCNIFIDSIKAH